MNNALNTLLPTQAEIPASVRLLTPIHQRHRLIDGDLRAWDGPTHPVTTPSLVRQPSTDSSTDVVAPELSDVFILLLAAIL